MSNVIVSPRNAIIQAANRWRAETCHPGGVVVMYGEEFAGWMDRLRDPQHWAPGAIAIDELGNIWKATGGDDYNGAELWEKLGYWE